MSDADVVLPSDRVKIGQGYGMTELSPVSNIKYAYFPETLIMHFLHRRSYPPYGPHGSVGKLMPSLIAKVCQFIIIIVATQPTTAR